MTEPTPSRGLLKQLFQRKLAQWLLGYAAGAWVALQVLGLMAESFEWPRVVMRMGFGLALTGFVLAMVFAWYHGERGAQRATRVEAILLALVAVVGSAATWRMAKVPEVPTTSATPASARTSATGGEAADSKATGPPRSIAVLPFLNMSSDPEQEYFSDGMTEEILNALAKVPGLAVTARTSVFSLKGEKKDVREIGKLLGVAFVLEGSVRRAGNDVRITAQLIRADNGFHLWSETYDRKLEHVFALQAELAGAIAKALALPLGVGGAAALSNPRTKDPQAYAMYLQARTAYRARGEGVQRSVDLYREVLQRDPDYAPAWSGLCTSLAVVGYYLPDSERVKRPAFLREAEEAGRRALALAPESADAHTALGKVYAQQWRWVKAGEHYERALALAPHDAELLFGRSDWLIAMGRFDEALRLSQEAVSLEPLLAIFLHQNARALSYAQREAEALGQSEAAHALAPENLSFTLDLVGRYLRHGRTDDAERLLQKVKAETEAVQTLRLALRLARNPGQRQAIREASDPSVFQEALAAIGQPDIDYTLSDLGRQLDERLDGMRPVLYLRRPELAIVHDDPRYVALLKKAGFDQDGKPLPDEAGAP